MKITEELKEIYEANPDEWIAVTPDFLGGWMRPPEGKEFGRGRRWRIIHIKHKPILDAYLADNSVEIEVCFEAVNSDPMWYRQDNFIENYNPDLEYRLKDEAAKGYKDTWDEEKEDGRVLHGMDNDNTANDDVCINKNMVEGLNNFRDIRPTRVEVIQAGVDREFSKWLKDAEYEIQIQDDGRTIKLFETPIKREWYEYEENFPALIRIDDRFEVANSINNLLDVSGNIVSTLTTLATRDEVMSLLVEEDDD